MEENVLQSHYFPSRGKYLLCAEFTCKVAVAPFRAVYCAVHLGSTEGCLLGQAVGEYTSPPPIWAQPSSPFSFYIT